MTPSAHAEGLPTRDDSASTVRWRLCTLEEFQALSFVPNTLLEVSLGSTSGHLRRFSRQDQHQSRRRDVGVRRLIAVKCLED